ncbi:MAG: PEGA domain-containing protein [Thermoanaerobaculia bacterium]|nr:PEGA domain-containing protein [Thermoanaerobaculia bacterium]
MMRTNVALVLLGSSILLAGCASNSGVQTVGPDTFMVSRQAATGFSGLGTLKADAMSEAQRYCASKKKELKVIGTSESKPPYLLGNFPRAEVHFMCLSESDPDLSRPNLQPVPDVVIQDNTAPPPPVARPSERTEAELVPVKIDSEPAGADVYVDGAFVGNTPLPGFKMLPGAHLLEISSRGFVKWNRSIRVQAGVPTSVNAVLEVVPDR